MRTITRIVLLLSLLAFTARAAVIPIRITDFPRTNTVPPHAFLLLAITNSVERTNYHVVFSNLFHQITSAIPVSVNSFTNGSNFFISGTDWTNISGHVRLVGGSTNTARFDTNNNRGLLIGDTSIATTWFGWPSDGQSYLSVYDGSTGHLLNRWTHGVLSPSTTNGSYAVVTSQSGVNPTLTEAFVVLTNGVIASEFDINMQRTGSYLLLGGNVNDGFVGIQHGAQVSTPIGGNLIRAKWGKSDRFFIATNGAASFFGSATNYGVLYAKSNFIVSGTSLLQGTLAVNGPALFLNGLGSTGITNTIGFQTLGRISLGDDPAELTTSSNLFRQYGPMHIHDDLFLQNPALTPDRVLYLDAGREVATATFAPTEVSTIVNMMNASNVLSGLLGPGASLWTNQFDLSILRPIAGSTNFIGGGTGNVIDVNNTYSTIGGGRLNTISTNSSSATIGGGAANTIFSPTLPDNFSTIGGGYDNGVFSLIGTISGGAYNRILGPSVLSATIGGGYSNTIDTAGYAFIPGGSYNTISANATNAGVIGSFTTNTTPLSVELGYFDVNKVRIDRTNLHLIGDMKIRMTNGATLNAVLTSDANGELTLQSFGGGGGGGSAGSGTFINSSNGSGSNATFYGKLAVNTNVFVITNGMIGIGTNAPSAIMHVTGPSSANLVRIGQPSTSVSTNSDLGGASLFASKSPLYVSYEGTDADPMTIDSSSVSAPGIALRRSRNTLMNITNVAMDDQVGYLDFRAFSGDRYWQIGGVQCHIDAPVINGQAPAMHMRFNICQTNSPSVEGGRIDRNGNWLIGTTSQSGISRMVVKQITNMPIGDYTMRVIGATNLNNSHGIRIVAGTSSSDFPLSVYGAEDTTNLFQLKGNGDGYIKGAFGIGDSTPDAPLDIEAASAFMLVTSTTGINSSYVDYVNTGGIVRVGRERSTGGGLVAGSSAYAGVVTVQSAHPLQFGAGSAIRMTITDTGKVGIGTNAPAAQLHVTADNSSDLILQAGTTNKPSLLTLSTNGFLALMSGTIYQSNSLALPTAAQIGNGNVWVGMSNGFLVSLKSNGAVNSMLVIH